MPGRGGVDDGAAYAGLLMQVRKNPEEPGSALCRAVPIPGAPPEAMSWSWCRDARCARSSRNRSAAGEARGVSLRSCAGLQPRPRSPGAQVAAMRCARGPRPGHGPVQRMRWPVLAARPGGPAGRQAGLVPWPVRHASRSPENGANGQRMPASGRAQNGQVQAGKSVVHGLDRRAPTATWLPSRARRVSPRAP